MIASGARAECSTSRRFVATFRARPNTCELQIPRFARDDSTGKGPNAKAREVLHFVQDDGERRKGEKQKKRQRRTAKANGEIAHLKVAATKASAN